MDIGIFDTRPMVAIGLRVTLEAISGFQVQLSSAEFVPIAPGRIDVLLMENTLAGSDLGLENLRAVAHATNVLVVSSADAMTRSDSYLHAGAKGCINVTCRPEDLLATVRTLAAGGQASSAGRAAEALSSREQDVLGCIAHGLTNRQIARRLRISEHTVDTYIKRAKQKLNLDNKAQLALAAQSLAL